jgi:hypothetical protein
VGDGAALGLVGSALFTNQACGIDFLPLVGVQPARQLWCKRRDTFWNPLAQGEHDPRPLDRELPQEEIAVPLDKLAVVSPWKLAGGAAAVSESHIEVGEEAPFGRDPAFVQ